MIYSCGGKVEFSAPMILVFSVGPYEIRFIVSQIQFFPFYFMDSVFSPF